MNRRTLKTEAVFSISDRKVGRGYPEGSLGLRGLVDEAMLLCTELRVSI